MRWGLALSLTVMILALTPTASIVYWVESNSEVIYSGPGYSVVYRPSLIDTLKKFRDVRIRLEVVDEKGRPLTFSALFSGPSTRGVVELGSATGKGYAVKIIEWKYVDREIDGGILPLMRPISGVGVLVLISTLMEERGEKYVAVDAVSIPLIPKKAEGKEISVTVKFKPIAKYYIGKTERASEGQTSGYPQWRLARTLYMSDRHEYIPLIITKLNEHLVEYASLIRHRFNVILYKMYSPFIGFDVSLGFAMGSTSPLIVSAGPGYIMFAELYDHWVHGVYCDSYLNHTGGVAKVWCDILMSGIMHTQCWSRHENVSPFTGDVMFSTGILGRVWLAEYKLTGREGKSETPFDGSVFAIWLIPLIINGANIYGWFEIEDNPSSPNTTTGRIVKILEENMLIRYKRAKTRVLGWGYTLDIRHEICSFEPPKWRFEILEHLEHMLWYTFRAQPDLYRLSEALGIYERGEWRFGAIIPVGAMVASKLEKVLEPEVFRLVSALGVAYETGSKPRSDCHVYYSYVDTSFTTEIPYGVFFGYYAELSADYWYKRGNTHMPAPLLIVEPVPGD